MSKDDLDFSADLGELSAQLAQVESAEKRLSEFRGQKGSASAQSKEQSPTCSPTKTKQVIPSVGEKKSAKRRTHQIPPTVEKKYSKYSRSNDPWVSASFKVRNSKKLRLHELSLRRQLAGELPYEKQHLIDEAIDHILAKYRGSTRGTKDSM